MIATTFTTAEQSQRKAVGLWLSICALIVYVMIIVGGLTRLTQSGLSMVEWEPIMGTIPPLSLADWQDVFNKYRQSPEYLTINKGMSLAEFKNIFWWEYGHRVLGRFIGLLFFLPFMFFLFKGYLKGAWTAKLFGLFLLGGLQAVVGWYMVKSGLVNDPHVSQYRLAAHFGIALLIYVVMIWFMLDFMRGEQRREQPVLTGTASLSVVLIIFMMLTGAFVAGLKAGHIYNTFPKMGHTFIPKELFAIPELWRNFFENPVTVQFIHRSLAYLVAIVIFTLFFKGWEIAKSRPDLKLHANLCVMLVLTLGQICLGIITLLKGVPILWGGLHQATGVLLITSVLFLSHRLSREY